MSSPHTLNERKRKRDEERRARLEAARLEQQNRVLQQYGFVPPRQFPSPVLPGRRDTAQERKDERRRRLGIPSSPILPRAPPLRRGSLIEARRQRIRFIGRRRRLDVLRERLPWQPRFPGQGENPANLPLRERLRWFRPGFGIREHREIRRYLRARRRGDDQAEKNDDEEKEKEKEKDGELQEYQLRVHLLPNGREYQVVPPESPFVAEQWSTFQRIGRWQGRKMHVVRNVSGTLMLDNTPEQPHARDRDTGCLIRNVMETPERHILELDAMGLIPLITHLTKYSRQLDRRGLHVDGFRLTAIGRDNGMVFLESDVLEVRDGAGGLDAIALLELIDYMVSIWVALDDPSPGLVARMVGDVFNEFQPLFDHAYFRMEFYLRDGGGCSKMRGQQVLKKRRLVWSPDKTEGENNCFFACLKEADVWPERWESADAARVELGIELGRVMFATEVKAILKKEKIPYRLLLMYNAERDDKLYMSDDWKEEVDTCRMVCYRGHFYLDRGEERGVKTCPLCHCVHWFEQPCQALRVRHWQRKKGVDPETTTAYYDAETRNDQKTARVTYEKELWAIGPQENALLPTRRVVYRQIPVAISIYYQTETVVYMGLDCLDKMFEWLNDHPMVLKMMAHNGARFDSLLVREYAVAKGWPIRNLIQANGRLLSMMIKEVEFGCTFRFLPRGLKAIGQDFQIDEEKMTEIPKEKQEEGLKTMDDLLLYRKDDWTPEEYLAWVNADTEWAAMYSRYCGLDSRVLGKAWEKFRAAMKDLFQTMYVERRQFRGKHPSTEVDAFCTLPQMVYAHWKFQTKTRAKLLHIEDDPIILPRVLYDFYRLFIIGGRSQQVPGYYREPLLYVDVVSLYPCVQSIYPYPTRKYPEKEVQNYQPGALGLYCIRNLRWPSDWEDFNPFPARDEKGHRLFWDLTGVERPLLVTSVDLMMAEEVGATYEVVWGYVWTRTWNPFSDFMNYFVRVKKGEDAKPSAERNQAIRHAAKLCLVSLYGKMAQAPPKYEYEEFDVEKGEQWERTPPKKKSDMSEFERYKKWTRGEWEVVTQIQQGSRVRIFRRPTFQETENRKYHPAHYGVFILAWSRYHMFQYAKKARENCTGKPLIYGSETDSLILPKRIEKNFQAPIGGSYSFEAIIAGCPFHMVGLWRRYWEKYEAGIFCLGSEIGNIVDEVASAGKGVLDRALLVQPKTYALRFVKSVEGKPDEIEWHKRWKGIPTKTRDGKEIIQLKHYVSVLQNGGVSFTRLTAFLRIQEDLHRLPGVAVAEISKTVVRPLENREREEEIQRNVACLDTLPQTGAMQVHLRLLQDRRTAQRNFGRMRAQMEGEEKPETTLVKERFKEWMKERRRQAKDMAFHVGHKRNWEAMEYDTWEERWRNAFALAQTSKIREEEAEEIEEAVEMRDYDQDEKEEADECSRCVFVEEMANECMGLDDE